MPGTILDTGVFAAVKQNSQTPGPMALGSLILTVVLRRRGGNWGTECPPNPDWTHLMKAGTLFSRTSKVLEHIVGIEGLVVEQMNEQMNE